MPRGTLTVVLVSANVIDNPDLLKGIDPFVIFTCGNQKQKSNAAAGQGTSPEWNETFTFDVSRGTSVLKAKIVDKDDYSIDDMVGKAIIPLEPVFVEENIPPMAYNIVKDEELIGEIWVALSFKPSENQSKGSVEESYEGWNNEASHYG